MSDQQAGPPRETDDQKASPISLSNVLAEGGVYIDPNLLEVTSQQATLVLKTEESKRSPNDQIFLKDYVLIVAKAKIKDAELDRIVSSRAVA